MILSKNINLLKNKIFTNQSRKLFYYSIAHTIYSTLAAPFEIVLALRLVGSFQKIIFFYFALYFLLFVAFVLGSYLIRHGKASRSFRLDLVLQASACLFIVIFFNKLSNPFILIFFFMLRGLSEGFYWSVRHAAILFAVKDSDRDSFGLRLQSIQIMLAITLPAISGFIISFIDINQSLIEGTLPSGYFPVFLVCAIFIILALLASPHFLISKQELSIKKISILATNKKNKAYMAVLFISSFAGIGIVLSVGILNFSVLKKEFAMGIFASLIALASAVFFFTMQKFKNKIRIERLKMTGIGAFFETSSRLVYLLFPTFYGLVIKSMLDGFLVPLKNLFGENILRIRIEQNAHEYNLSRSESILFQESVVFIARMSALLVLALVFFGTSFSLTTIALTILGIFSVSSILEFFMYRIIDLNNKNQLEK